MTGPGVCIRQSTTWQATTSMVDCPPARVALHWDLVKFSATNQPSDRFELGLHLSCWIQLESL